MQIRAHEIWGSRSKWIFFALPALAGLAGCGARPEQLGDAESVGRVESALSINDFQDASGLVRIRIKTCDPVGSHFEPITGKNVAETACPVDAGWAMVGGGAEIIGEGTPGALLKASIPNPNGFGGGGDFTSWLARSSDTRMSNGSQAFPHQLRSFVIGMQLVQNGTPFAPSVIPGQDSASGDSVANPTATSSFGAGTVVIGGGAEVLPDVIAEPESLYPDLYLTESRRAGNGWRGSAKNNQTGDTGGIKAYAIGIDPCPAGWGGRCLAFSQTQASGGPAAGYVAASANVGSPWVMTSIGGEAAQGGGAGRYLADLIPFNGTAHGFTVRSKDHGGSDSAATNGMAIRVGAPQPATITVGAGCTFVQALATVNQGQAVGSCAAPSGLDTIRLVASATPHVVTGINLEVLRPVTIAGAGSASSTLQFSGGVTGNSDAALRIVGGVMVTIRDITLRGANGNQLSAVKNVDSLLTLSNMRITNFGYAGVHILNAPASASIAGSTIDGNGAFGEAPLGGGVLNFGILRIESSTISNNFAFEGGGIANFGQLDLIGSTLEGNEGLITGGGLHHECDDDTPTEVINATFTGNSAGDEGGGAIFAAFTGTTSARFGLIHNTIALNDSASVGGGIYVLNTSATNFGRPIMNIIANNTAPVGADIFSDAPFPLDLANNLVTSSAALSPAVACAAANECPNPSTCQHPICGDPRLGPLAVVNNRPRSFSLLPSGPPSPAIDAAPGGGSDVDQRGNPRPIDGNRDNSAFFDFGSVEFDPNVVLFGFESLADWTSSAPLSLDSVRKTQGLFGLRVGGSGFRTVQSAPLRTPPNAFSPTLRLDFFLPGNQPNPFWLGAVQAHATCASANLFNEYIGQVELTGRPTNAFSTLALPLPASVAAALSQPHTDCFLSISVNTNPTPVSPVLDNLRFGP